MISSLARQAGGALAFVRRPAAAGPALAPAVLIVSSRHRLWQRYGPDGVFAIERCVGELVDAMAARGLAGTLVYADDSPLLTRYGLLPADTGRAESVAKLVRGLAGRLAWTEEDARYVLLLGDDGIVPFGRPENPSPEDEDELFSDQLYGAQTADPLRPATGRPRAVGRIPDAGIELLLGALRAASAAHRRLAAAGPAAPPTGGFGYTASVWKRAARGVFAAIGDPRELRQSPPLTHEDRPLPGADGPRRRYFNLHGLVDSPHWYGQRDPSFPADYPFYPVALRPEDLAPAPGSVVFSEACFGAHLSGRSTQGSIALTFLAGGALAFVGATGVAYGGLDGPLVAADLLARRFWELLGAGLPVGRALSEAKASMIGEVMARQGTLDAEEEKAALNFVLYGDPSLATHVPSVWAEDAVVGGRVTGAVERAGPVALVGTPPVRPHNSRSRSEAPARAGASDRVPDGLLAHVRKTVAERLPEFGAGDVRVVAERSPARAVAKAADRDADGREADGGGLVVTLRKSLPTCEGPCCPEVVRVTVDGRGRIRKVTVSR